MKHNAYNSRRQQRYEAANTPPIGKKLVEQFVAQVIFCAFLILSILGVRFLGLSQIEGHIDRMKSAIVYSPSLDEITQSAKDVLGAIKNKADPKGKEEAIPVILIDNEMF